MSDESAWKLAVARDLRAAMQRKGMSQAALARTADVSEATLRRILQATGSPTVENLSRLARALGTRVDFSFVPPKKSG